MPANFQPYLQQLSNKGSYTIPFSFFFNSIDDPKSVLAIDGAGITCIQFQLNATTVQGVIDLGNFKSISINAYFSLTANSRSGPIYIIDNNSKQMIKIVPEFLYTPPAGFPTPSTYCVCASFPLYETKALNLTLAASIGDGQTGGIFSTLSGIISTDECNSYISQGIQT